jgi:exopolysaccharide biosynthesis protein
MRFRALCVAALVVVAVSTGADAATAANPVRVRQLRWAGLQMDIATLRTGGSFVLRPALANRRVTTLQPVAGICGGCVVAINGDFFDATTEQPVGGVIVNGVVLRSPNPRQNQLTITPGGKIAAGFLQWDGRISFGSSSIPVAVNDPGAATPVLFNRRFGGATPKGDAVELQFVARPSTALPVGPTIRLDYAGPHRPGTRFSANHVVLRASAAYTDAVLQLRDRLRAKQVRATARFLTNPPAANSLGANHILMRGGRRLAIDEHDNFVNGRHPRTIFGWDGRGHITLVTIGSAVSGRRAGVSLRTAARLVESVGMTNAVNLDGGGSSTFIYRGRVRNHPSDGRPRAVANAWVILPRSQARRPAVAPTASSVHFTG